MNVRRLVALAGFGSVVGLSFAGPIKHNYDLKNVLWKLSFDVQQHTIVGDTTDTLTLGEDSATVQLHCGDLKIAEVSVNGRQAHFQTAENVLTVTLPTAAQAGQTLDVRVLYAATPQRGLYFVDPEHAFPSKTGMIYTQGEGEDNRYWLPTYDLPDDKATSECFITVPLSWTAVSNGKLLGVQTTGATRVFHWKMDQPYSTYLISLVAGEYVEGKSHWRQTPVSFFVPPGLEEEGRQSFGSTPKMIDLYSRLTGVPYPYPKFSQEVVGDFVVGGMENITAVTQMIRTLHAPSTEPLNDSTGLVAHELAHQWFGDLVTCRTWEHMWLNEGFATFMPLLLDRATHGQDVFDLDRYGNFEGAINSIGSKGRKDVPGKTGDVAQVTMGSPYPGGASRILMLMHKLGERTFWKGIHTYLTTYGYQPATTPQFFEVMSKVSGQDLSEFQSQWYHTAATPSLSVSIDGQDVVVTQLEPYYRLDLPLWALKDGRWTKRSIHVEGASSRLPLGDLAHQPLLLDPEVWTIMELNYKIPFTPEQVAGLYRHAPNAAQRARIVAGLFDTMPVPDRVKIARSEKLTGLQDMIVGHIGQEGSDYLLELTHSTDVHVVNAAVQRLGALQQSSKVVARLHELADSHPNEALREHALQALLEQSNDPSLAQGAWERKAFDDGFRVMALGWWAKHDPVQARAIGLKVLAGPDNEPVRLTAVQALEVVKDAPGEHAVFDTLLRVAQENSYRTRIAAIRALGALGNKDALPVLKAIPPSSAGGVLGAASRAIKLLS